MSTVRLGDIARVFNGNSISAAEKDRHCRGVDGLPYIGTAEVGFDATINYDSGISIPPSKRSLFKLAKAGTPLVCAEGGSAGRKVGFLDREAYFGNKLFAIEPNSDWNGKFIFYFAQSDAFRTQFRSLTTGLIGGVSIKKFKDIRVPRFFSEEQRRIVEVLDEAFAAVAAATASAQKNLANAQELFQAALSTWFNQVDAPRFRLADACERVTVGHVGTTSPHYRATGIPFLRTQNVGREGIRLQELVYITPDFHRTLGKSTLKAGDVLISRVVTDRMNVGVVPPDIGEANCANVICVRPGAKIEPHYLAYLIRSDQSQSELLGRRKGSAQQVVNTTELKNWRVPLPSLKQQQVLVERLTALESMTNKLRKIHENKLEALLRLKQSLLHRAFSGELTEREPLAA